MNEEFDKCSVCKGDGEMFNAECVVCCGTSLRNPLEYIKYLEKKLGDYELGTLNVKGYLPHTVMTFPLGKGQIYHKVGSCSVLFNLDESKRLRDLFNIFIAAMERDSE